MKRVPLLVAAVAVILAGVAFWLAGGQSGDSVTVSSVPPPVVPRPTKPQPAPPQPVKEVVTTIPPPAVVTKPSPSPPARKFPPPPQYAPMKVDPEKQAVEDIALNLRSFGQRFGGNPVGTNAEIVQALMGENAARATYLPPEQRKLNANGELIDRWGTPYFFHSDSATETEVRSAGPDKTLWTVDDIVAK
ncbi:MAG: hypothetical protein H7A55_16450 [Verrucomicrobiaceae bacterium]|nr:hypothetical protein [Verrucomicrobiaceae bacterium]